MSVKHYQIGVWITAKGRNIAGEIIAVHQHGDSYRYTVENGSNGGIIEHSEAMWLGDEKPDPNTLTIPIKLDLSEAEKQFKELQQYMDRVAYGAWPKTVFGATAKPQPKFKVGDQLQHTVSEDRHGEVISISKGTIDGHPGYNIRSPGGHVWCAPESYLELAEPKPAYYSTPEQIAAAIATLRAAKPTPKLYTATYRRDDGLYGLQFEAYSQADAEAHCKALGMTYGGIVG